MFLRRFKQGLDNNNRELSWYHGKFLARRRYSLRRRHGMHQTRGTSTHLFACLAPFAGATLPSPLRRNLLGPLPLNLLIELLAEHSPPRAVAAYSSSIIVGWRLVPTIPLRNTRARGIRGRFGMPGIVVVMLVMVVVAAVAGS